MFVVSLSTGGGFPDDGSEDRSTRAPSRPGGFPRAARRRSVPGVRTGFGRFPALLLAFACAIGAWGDAAAERWRGLEVAPERRCAPYDPDDYRYPQSVEPRIVAAQGGRMQSPYDGQCFRSLSETDIEHIVARSEAHDSGLCAADPLTRRRFAADLRNLTLASPALNRRDKKAKDAFDWMPSRNRCWFAAQVVEVRRAYGLTIDRPEAAALERVLSACESTEMVLGPCARGAAAAPSAPASPTTGKGGDVLRAYDDNRNGRITCAEARRHGIAPVRREHPAYRYMRDGDGDGVVCE